MQEEEKEGYKEKKEPEENDRIGDTEDPSLVEDQEETEEDEQEGEGESAEDVEEESLIEEELPQRHGCLRGCITPIIAILLVIMIAVIIIQSKRDDLREILLMRIIANTQNHALAELPEDMDEKAVEAEFGKVKTALKEDRVDEEALIEAIEEYQDSTREIQSLEQKRQVINNLVEDLNTALIIPE